MSELASTPDSRTTILAAAIEVLRSRGAAEFTIRNIAKAAGCSTTGVYTWFGGKNGLVDAIFVEGFESFDEELASATTTRETGIAYRRWAINNPTHYLVMFGRAVPTHKPGDAAVERASQSFARLVSSVGDQTLAYHVWATVHGYVMLELVGITGSPDLPSPEELYQAGLDRLM